MHLQLKNSGNDLFDHSLNTHHQYYVTGMLKIQNVGF